MSTQKPLSILISGGGIAGSTLALVLARQPSLDPKPIITLVERSPTPRTTGQAVDLRGPAVKAIRLLGLEKKIKDRHTSELGMRFINPGGKTIAQFDASGDSEKQSGPTSEFEILRGDLAQLLLDEVEETKKSNPEVKINIVYGESIQSLDEQEDGVTVGFNGKLETQKFDVVVAADGMASRTRSMIFNEYASEDIIKPAGWYIAYFTIPRLEDDESYWSWYNAPEGLVVHMRPHRDLKTMGVYLSIVLPTKARNPELEAILARGVDAQKAMLRKRFANVGWKTERLLNEMDISDDFYMQQVAQVKAPVWTKGRCALIGDSAHCTMGIGTSLAMIDAYTLSGELAKVTSNSREEVSGALHRFEELVMALVKENGEMPRGFPQLANPQTWWGIAIMHVIVRLVYWTKLDKLLMGLGEPSEEKWKLPDYGW
ncbi:FAD/NAD(P)-binding domain-containing protein [Amniculicola lignicola CBS 123094]|uniref:FAD/NAD(P)-binding domain-containing protein n=1 Tax=Amniculicola lignicola CBS 123094 TaxID=1392246 RepID=A0A6A5W1N2_9PLEO|nr:FAD/NAD(P)-binding domain-containing protein [Amniculicola lignicola CBS 123094]